jgi:hypothetical protein
MVIRPRPVRTDCAPVHTDCALVNMIRTITACRADLTSQATEHAKSVDLTLDVSKDVKLRTPLYLGI